MQDFDGGGARMQDSDFRVSFARPAPGCTLCVFLEAAGASARVQDFDGCASVGLACMACCGVFRSNPQCSYTAAQK